MKIADLLQLDGRIVVYLKNEELQKQFMKDAEEQGFTFGDGRKPTEKPLDDIIAVNKDMTLNYVGIIGHMGFVGTEENVRPLVRVDYEKFCAGEDYIIKSTPVEFGKVRIFF